MILRYRKLNAIGINVIVIVIATPMVQLSCVPFVSQMRLAFRHFVTKVYTNKI